MINKRQYNFLSFYLTRTLFFGGAISLLVGLSKNNLLISSIIGMILGYGLLYLFYKKGSINSYLRIVIAMLCLFIITLSNSTLTSSFLLYETPATIIMLVFLIPVIYGAIKKDEVCFRVTEMVYPVSLILVLFSFIALWYLVDLSNLFPLFNTSFLDFLKGILIFLGASLLPNLLLIRYKGNLSFKSISKGYLMGSLIIIIDMFFIISIYGSNFSAILRFPEYLILKKIDVFNYISNVENIFVLEWLCNLVISAIFCSREIYDNGGKRWFVVLMILLGFGIYLVINNSFYIILYVKKYIYYGCGGLIILSLLPLRSSRNLRSL